MIYLAFTMCQTLCLASYIIHLSPLNIPGSGIIFNLHFTGGEAGSVVSKDPQLVGRAVPAHTRLATVKS